MALSKLLLLRSKHFASCDIQQDQDHQVGLEGKKTTYIVAYYRYCYENMRAIETPTRCQATMSASQLVLSPSPKVMNSLWLQIEGCC